MKDSRRCQVYNCKIYKIIHMDFANMRKIYFHTKLQLPSSNNS
jgi:hypothetical protein